MDLFKDLTQEEIKEFTQWARDNYVIDSPIDLLWHPVIKNECRIMNSEEHLDTTPVVTNFPAIIYKKEKVKRIRKATIITDKNKGDYIINFEQLFQLADNRKSIIHNDNIVPASVVVNWQTRVVRNMIKKKSLREYIKINK